MRRHRSFVVIGLAFLVAVALSATLVSVAQASLPGDRLYDFKLALEHLRYDLTADPILHARLDLDFFARRLDELQEVLHANNSVNDPKAALNEVQRAMVEATQAVVTLPPEAQGDMRAELARLALRTVNDLAQWQQAGGNDPAIAQVSAIAQALAEAASNPSVSVAELLLALAHGAPQSGSSSNAMTISPREISIPPDLRARHSPPLTSKHGEISCNECHIDGKTTGLSPLCASCHEDVHKGKFAALGITCERCHTDVAFKPATFDHTNFPDCQACHQVDVPPNHFPGQCSHCHTTQAWKPANFDHTGFTDCAACHQQNAPANHFPGQCSNCHTTDAWKPANFNHTGFTDCAACHTQDKPANHFAGQCGNCHSTAAWQPAHFDHTGLTDCRSCHTNNAPPNHFQGQCSQCHNTTNWSQAHFDHTGLTDCRACHANNAPPNHFQGQCSQCHNTTNWSQAHFDHTGLTDCRACHANNAPPNHFQGQCSQCHNTTAWNQVNFNHTGLTDCRSCHTNNAPPNHFQGQCSQCHNTTNWSQVNFNHTGLTDCQSCHAGDAPPNHFPGQCSQCHNTTDWSQATFNHTFPLNHGGANSVCSQCHPGGDTSQWTCAGCHNYTQMDSRHQGIANYSHNCIQCHARGGGDIAPTGTTADAGLSTMFASFINPALRYQPGQAKSRTSVVWNMSTN